ncbi:hypothetical protein PUN28_008784 [Cardiocondyla obscurior]|uniref:Uncharacterized protein n=1 Tax=Cardiocondyla obscurior TaxID=286306 RepID=A0AAW2FQD9_9HYME
MPPVNGDYQNLDLSKAPFGLRNQRNLGGIIELKNSKEKPGSPKSANSESEGPYPVLLYTIFIRGGAREIRTDPPRRRGERSVPSTPSSPTSPAPEEVPLNVEEPREFPSPDTPKNSVNATESEPDLEQFRPTTPSYSPDISIHSPGAAPRACSSPIPSPIPHPGSLRGRLHC